MKSTITCFHCGKVVAKNPRIKAQHYCSLKECQQARRNQWERNKLQHQKVYREKRKLQKASWRYNRPAHEYQRQYRAEHPLYQSANQSRQINRNRSLLKIVKTDASMATPQIPSGIYKILPLRRDTHGKIVKTDAFLVEIQNYQELQR